MKKHIASCPPGSGFHHRARSGAVTQQLHRRHDAGGQLRRLQERSIYQLREVTEVTDSRVSVRAAVPILEASEALLLELNFLADE